MSDLPSTALILISLLAAVTAGRLQFEGAHPRRPWSTLAVGSALALCLALQAIAPGLLGLLQRDGPRIEAGEIYRLFTALWFQDHGVLGAAFNIPFLLLVGAVAEQLWARAAWLVLYFGGGLLAEAIALVWQPTGAGNSVATLSLGGSMLALAFTRPARPAARLVGALGLAGGFALAGFGNIHGAAVLFGACLGLGAAAAPAARFNAA